MNANKTERELLGFLEDLDEFSLQMIQKATNMFIAIRYPSWS